MTIRPKTSLRHVVLCHVVENSKRLSLARPADSLETGNQPRMS